MTLHLSAITTFAVKGLRGCDRREARVEPWGLADDRRFLVVDERGRFLTQRDCPRLAALDATTDETGLRLSADDGSALHVARPGAGAEAIAVTIWRDTVAAVHVAPEPDRWLSERLGRACRLVFMAEPATARPVVPAFAKPADHVSFADGFPVLAVSTTSLADLNARLPTPAGMDRFRANLVIDGAPPWAEDDWHHLRIGTVLFEAVKPCSRCIVTTIDQRSGSRDPGVEPIRTLQTFRRDKAGQVLFGQNLVPRSLGTVRVGDSVEILASRAG